MSSSNTLLYLVRHGESIWNVEKRLTGWSDVELSETGRQQAQALRPLVEEHGPFDRVWSSPLQRAHQTALLAGTEPQVLEPRLREFHFGEHEGLRVADLNPDYLKLFRDFDRFEAPGGESGSSFHQRIDAFLDELDPGRHLLFTHGGVVRRVLQASGRVEFVKNAGLTVVNWSTRTIVEHFDNPLYR